MSAGPWPVVTLVSQRHLAGPGGLPALAAAAAAAGIDFIQVREKDLGDGALFDLVAQVMEAVGGTATRVLVNGRPDIAEVAGAAGVQLPEDGLPVGEVKRAFPRLLAGVSCHSPEAARRAAAAGADFVLLGPIFTTPGKEQRTLGTGPLAEACRTVRVPVHAIGGVEPETAGSALAAGARGLAAIRTFLDRPLPEVVRALKHAGS